MYCKITKEKELISTEIQNLTPAELFKPDMLSKVVSTIKQLSLKHTPDVSTAKGRKEIASLANKIAQAKTFLDDAGKKLVSGWKNQAKLVDTERKTMRDELDALKKRVRKLLTEWEAAEAVEKAKLQKRIEYFDEVALVDDNESAEVIEHSLNNLTVLSLEGLGGFTEGVTLKKTKLIASLETKLATRKQFERDQVKLTLLKIAAAAKEAKAIKLAETKEREAREARIAKEAAAKARLEVKEAVKKEREQTETKRIKTERLEKARQADRTHQKKVNNAAVASLQKINGIDKQTAMQIVKHIINGNINNVKIIY